MRRSLTRDDLDALMTELVDADEVKALIEAIPSASYASYPRLSVRAVQEAVDAFFDSAVQ